MRAGCQLDRLTDIAVAGKISYFCDGDKNAFGACPHGRFHDLPET